MLVAQVRLLDRIFTIDKWVQIANQMTKFQPRPKLKARLSYSLKFFPRGRISQVCQTKAAQNSGRSLRLEPPNSPLTQASSNSPLSQGTASCRCSLATDTLAHTHAAGWPRAQAWGLSGQSSSKANINTQYTNIGTQRKASSGPEIYLLFVQVLLVQ